jgi:hypothetical protein
MAAQPPTRQWPCCSLRQWQDVADHLAPFPTDDTTGLLIGAGSHLFAIHPMHLTHKNKAEGSSRGSEGKEKGKREGEGEAELGRR